MELGTSKMSAQSYLRSVFIEEEQAILTDFALFISAGIEDLAKNGR